MNLPLTFGDRGAGASLRHFFQAHPEWWSVGLCGLAWALMVRHGWQHSGHALHQRVMIAPELFNWMAMVAAMMLPLVIDRVQVTAQRSLWARRHRAIGGFLAGYFLVWLLLGAVVVNLRQTSWSHGYAAPALSFAAAALWQRTRMHQRALTVCHRTLPLAPVGWQADLDCLRFGGTVGVACVGSCWPLMLACAFAGHSLIAMTGGMAVGAVERWSWPPRNGAMLAATLLLAGYYVLLAVLDLRFALPVDSMMQGYAG